MGRTLVFYDGVCGMCSRLTQVVIAHDRSGSILFAALQSDEATRLLRAHEIRPDSLETMVVLTSLGTGQERAWIRSAAVFELCRQLGGWFRVISWARILPRFLTDAAYRLIARTRYRFFGKFKACPIPSEKQRARFIG